MQIYVQVCVRWLKYTSLKSGKDLNLITEQNQLKLPLCLNYHQLGEKVNDYMSGGMQILLELKRNIIYL